MFSLEWWHWIVLGLALTMAEMDIPVSLALGQWIEQPESGEPAWTQVKKSRLALAYLDEMG